MSYWQWTRYLEKKVYFSRLEAQSGKTVAALDSSKQSWEDDLLGTFSVEGAFDFSKEVYLINRSMNEMTGVRVVTPFQVKNSEKHILVDRGFLEYEDYAQKNHQKFQSPQEQSIVGILRPAQQKSFFLAPPIKAPEPGTWKDRWLRLEVDKMAVQLPYPVLPVYIEQTNQALDWPKFDEKEITSPGRHLNYTFQWIGFAFFALFIAFFLQFRPANLVRQEMAGSEN